VKVLNGERYFLSVFIRFYLRPIVFPGNNLSEYLKTLRFIMNDTSKGVPMETAAEFAKKYGLEQYLDKPDDLNDAIFNLMLLQETVHLERARNMKIGATAVSVKRSAQGSFIVTCTGDKAYSYAVETALKAGTTVIAVFQRRLFIGMLRSMGVPEDKIAEFCDSVVIDDATLCFDKE
jgi:hypothetical protein